VSDFSLPNLVFRLVGRTEVSLSRPALEAARYRCESCRREDGLRVAEGAAGQLVVLCVACAGGDRAFKSVVRLRAIAVSAPCEAVDARKVRSNLSPSDRITIRLEAVGFTGVKVYPARAAWRSDVRREVYRWEGSAVAKGHPALSDGFPVTFGSWDRMTDCARRGVVLASDGLAGAFLVSATPRKPKTADASASVGGGA
jgi:hypothetical protein